MQSWLNAPFTLALAPCVGGLLLGCANDMHNAHQEAHARPAVDAQAVVGSTFVKAAPPTSAKANAIAKASARAIAKASANAAAKAKPAVSTDRYAAPRSWPPPSNAGATGGDRIYSRVRHLWVRPAPNSKAWIGYLSLGDSVRVKGGDAELAFKGNGYSKNCLKWYAVEPSGYVCVGRSATLDKDDPIVGELASHRADGTSPWPYHYAESLEVPVYHAVPSKIRQRSREPQLAKHLDALAARRAEVDADPFAKDGAIGGPAKNTSHTPITPMAAKKTPFLGVDVRAAGKGPPTLLDLPVGGKPVKTRVAFGSTLAFVDDFDHAGRTFLLTWDRGIVPKDKVRPYPKSPFKGVVLDAGMQLPLAFARVADQPKYRRSGEGQFEKLDSSWSRLSVIALSGRSETAGKQRFHETKEAGIWCAAKNVTVARKAKKLPAQIRSAKKEGRRSWLDISILGGTLVAYEYDKPVYATLISPGRGGIPQTGVPTLDTASTPTGNYYILGKFVTATMVSSSNSSLVHSEVQYTQNITGPYALHGAYWHDRWGEKMSGGCVNLAPTDAMRIFEWTSPRMPAGWHGMRTIDFGDKTLVHLHR